MAATVALLGVTHPAARALALALEADDGVERVLGFARDEPPVLGPKLEYVPAGRSGPGDRLQGVDVVVCFPQLDAGARDQTAAGRAAYRELEQVLSAAAQLGAGTVVLWSSGLVYGAHPGNPVPLAEDRPARPDHDVPAAVHLAELERLVLGWRDSDGGVVLRAAPVWAPSWAADLGSAAGGSFAGGRALQAPVLLGVAGAGVPVQALHPDDAAGALTLAVSGRLRGVYNVAPNDWLPPAEAAVAAGRRRVLVPKPVAASLAGALWSPAQLRHQLHPCVLDSARLRAAGWTAAHGTASALAAAGRLRPGSVAVGGLNLRRGDVYRGVGVSLAAVAVLALTRRRAGRR